MTDILKPIGDNIGGLQKLEFIPIIDVDSIPDPVQGTIDDPILKLGKRWFQCYFSPGTLGFSEEKNNSGAGIQYNPVLTPFIPKDNPELSAILREMDGYLFLVKYQDNNGYMKLVGDLNTGLRFESSLSTGNTPAERNGHKLKFTAIMSHKAWFINE